MRRCEFVIRLEVCLVFLGWREAWEVTSCCSEQRTVVYEVSWEAARPPTLQGGAPLTR